MAITDASNAFVGATSFPEQSEVLVVEPEFGVGQGVGAGGAGVVGGEFISPAHTGIPTASASASDANNVRAVFISGLLKQDLSVS